MASSQRCLRDVAADKAGAAGNENGHGVRTLKLLLGGNYRRNSGVAELRAWVNGIEFRFFAEYLSRERNFGQTTIRLTGRGCHAVLDAPYAPTLTFNNPEQRKHEQLFDDVLQHNHIALGWSVDYGLQDWSIPAGAQ